MIRILKERLWTYIAHNNPDLMYDLQEDYSVMSYLEHKTNGVLPLAKYLLSEGKSQYMVEKRCLDSMTRELQPSRFLYVQSVLKEEFLREYEQLREEETLTSEILQMLDACEETFDKLKFSEQNENERPIRDAIIVQVHNYLRTTWV